MWLLMESTKQLCDDKRAACHTWHALKLQYEQQVLGVMEGAQLEVHLVAATIPKAVKEGMEAKAEQAGNVHVAARARPQ